MFSVVMEENVLKTIKILIPVFINKGNISIMSSDIHVHEVVIRVNVEITIYQILIIERYHCTHVIAGEL